jgi:rhamnulokinase
VGSELPAPVINAQTLDWNFTNEGGVCDTIRLLKNVAGLWLVQQCRATWASKGEPFSYAELTQMAANAPPFQAIIDPDFGEFLKPGDMPARIQAYCQATGQPVLEDRGAIIRCILEGLALKYRLNLERLEQIVGRELNPLHIVGGGTQNSLLNQLTADATGRLVLTGPVEATALGNVLMQALATSHIRSLAEGRELIRRSFTPTVYEPGDPAPRDEAYGRFQALL